MNFGKIPSVHTAEQLLDIAFRAARTKEVKRTPDRIKTKRSQELGKIETATHTITLHLDKVLKGFPSIDSLPPFYKEVVKATVDYASLKKSLGAVNWAIGQLRDLQKAYERRLGPQRNTAAMSQMRQEFYGRISSVVKQIKRELLYLEASRKIMKEYPVLRTDCMTVAIAGYPNVGKSSLLRTLTTARPEVQAYAFTTKQLNLGYSGHVQYIDTPGTFDRDMSEMNRIELLSYHTLTYLADVILFVIDDTQAKDLQEGLRKRMYRFKKPVIVVHSKADLVSQSTPTELYVSAETREGIGALKRLVEQHEAERKHKDHKH
jgi:nucleolar GTP-binding protein